MSFLLIFFILSTSLSCKKENIQIISDQEELNNIINYGIEKIEKTSIKEIFKILAKGY